MPSEWAIARAKQYLSRVWDGAFKETSRDNLPALLDDVRRETAREILINGPLAKRDDVEPLVRAERERFGLEDGDDPRPPGYYGEPVEGDDDACPNGLLPDGPVCPRCGVRRGPSGVDGGTWVHWPEEDGDG